jgi:hypothetical protein
MTALRDLTAFAATYKTSPTARKVKTITAFFATTEQAAIDYARRVVAAETFGAGVLSSVEEASDPREGG